ncbi:MAG: tyrosine-type recombinase/integrase [Porphyrobacter sp.]|nr:tyrosine-type recombinase/integrase [Porphyrobacter sp.]
MALTVKEIDNAVQGAKDRKLTDEKGLYLLVAASGSKRWQLKYRFQGNEKKISLGVYPEVSLKAARTKRDEARALLADGRDPSRVKQENKLKSRLANANTFGAIAREFIAKRVNDGDDSICETTQLKTEWLLSLVEPALGKLPVSEITAPMLLSVLMDIQGTGRRETARRLRSFVGRVLNYAIATGRRTDANPAPALRGALSTPTVRNHPAIVNRQALGSLLKAMEGYGGFASTAGALRISAHLFQRPGEIRTMKWADLDLESARWIIPASDTKMRREHVVPLSRQAIEIIRSMADIAGNSEFVFPSHNPKKPLSENAVNGALRRLGYAGVMTAHGFRSTACSLLNECGKWNPDAIERALAHQDGNAVRAVYNRTAYLPERVEMMQWWSDELESLKAAPD